jgi:hypothetical protein
MRGVLGWGICCQVNHKRGSLALSRSCGIAKVAGVLGTLSSAWKPHAARALPDQVCGMFVARSRRLPPACVQDGRGQAIRISHPAEQENTSITRTTTVLRERDQILAGSGVARCSAHVPSDKSAALKLTACPPARGWFPWSWVGASLFCFATGLMAFSAIRAESPRPGSGDVEEQVPEGQHPIDPALRIAREGVAYLQSHVADYTATIVKRERVNGKLGETQYVYAKIRNRKRNGEEIVTPFSVYLKFLKPNSVKGREVIWVENANDGKLIAHEAGLLNIRPVYLDPNGYLAMLGQRYPISKIGIENLVSELIVKGEAQRQVGKCEVNFFKNAKIDDRLCMLIEVINPKQLPNLEFYRAHIFIDNELNVPVRYAAWSWPETPGGEPILLEEYTYRNIQLNVGLTEQDFNPENPNYQF